MVGVQYLVSELGTSATPLETFLDVEKPECWKRMGPYKRWTMQWACKSFDGLMDMGIGTQWETRRIHGIAGGLPNRSYGGPQEEEEPLVQTT